MSKYITSPELARRLGLRPSTLSEWRRVGKDPKGGFFLTPNRYVYPLDEVEKWLAERAAQRPDFSSLVAAAPHHASKGAA